MLLRNDIGLLTKNFTIVNSKKVNAIGTQGSTSSAYDSGLYEEAKYLDCELAGF